MLQDANIAFHEHPAAADRADFVLFIDLAPFGMPGRSEQFWVRRIADGLYEVCCIPFFSYGIALGDTIRVKNVEAPCTIEEVPTRSGRVNIRLAFVSEQAAQIDHGAIHSALAHDPAPHEWRAGGYLAVSTFGQEELDRIWRLLLPFADRGVAHLELDQHEPPGHESPGLNGRQHG